MSESIIETARAWIIEAQVGLIDQSELIERVDRALVGLADPPDPLIAISMDEDTAWSGRLDLVLHRVSDSDAAQLAKHLLTLLHASQVTGEQLETIAFSAAKLIPDSEYSQGQFMAIEDELYVIRECGGSMDQATKDAESRLKSIVEYSS